MQRIYTEEDGKELQRDDRLEWNDGDRHTDVTSLPNMGWFAAGRDDPRQDGGETDLVCEQQALIRACFLWFLAGRVLT